MTSIFLDLDTMTGWVETLRFILFNATVRITGLNYQFRITNTERLGNNVRLTWHSVLGTRYFLQGSAHFTSWTTWPQALDASNRTTTFILTNAVTGPFRFLRAAVDTGP